ncbi:MAG TPA: J domain-containing protein [Candidatus Scybalousia intestinigallinarum]|nr:J domain-containing protein [Candidatus Scybalousia intestinigallinarum]
MKNYYEILGITSNATLEEIRKAYYKQARKYHPDNNPGQDTTDMMQQITLAYNTLSDEQSKKQYDATLRREQDQTSFNNTTTNTNGSYTHTQNSEDL